MRRARATLAIAAVALLALAPALMAGLESLRGPGGWSLAAYADVLAGPRQRGLFLRSLLVAGGAAALALVWGTALGYALWRARGWRRALLETLACLPLLLPSLVLALGWMFFLGRAGVLTAWLAARLGLASGASVLYSPAGAAFVLSLCVFPCVAILAAQGFDALDRAGLRAARLAAGPGRILRRIVWPALAPHLATGAGFAFLLAFADFGVPSALMVNVYPVEVFAQASARLDPHSALASAAPAAGLLAALFLVRHRFVRAYPAHRPRAVSAPDGRASRLGLALAGLALLLSLGIPFSFLLLTARGAYAQALRIAGEQVLTSLEVALLGTLLAVLGGLVFALGYRQLATRGRALAEAAILLPLLVPGAAMGLGLLALVGAGIWPFAALYPSPAILAYASAARFLAFPALILAAALVALGTEPWRAAAAHGAGPWRAAFRIGAPLLAPALARAATVAFVLALGELSAAVLVSPPGSMTLAIRLASLLHFGKDSIVAALCVMLCALVVVLLTLGMLLAGAPLGLRLQHADRAL